MGDEHDSWLGGIGVDVPDIVSSVTAAAETVQSAASSAVGAASSAASTALDAGNTAGKAVISAESAAWDGTKSAYNTVTSTYDSVAPNFTKANQDLGNLVDTAEAAAKKGNENIVAAYADVPVLGSVAKGTAALNNATVEVAGGAVKAAGDLAAMAGNAMFHPIDATESLAEGALGIAEHVPLVPGLNTTVKGIHGAVDLARGKKDGQYGSSVGELAENLLLNTRQDPNDPSKKTNADIDFAASIGGGTKAWKEKPLEAAARTVTNIGAMFLGEEAAGAKPPPEGMPPTLRSPTSLQGEPIPPGGEPTLRSPTTLQGEPMPPGEAPPGTPPTLRSPTAPELHGGGDDFPFGGEGNGPTEQPEPPTLRDPVKPEREPEAPNADEPLTPEQLKQNEIDTGREWSAAERAANDAAGELVRYRATAGRPGGPEYEGIVEQDLENEVAATAEARDIALKKYEAAKRANQKPAGRPKGKKGGSLFGPPKKK